MDLGKRAQLSPEERLGIAQNMQIVLLDEIARNVRWKIGEAAFHGGTSISSAWNSSRWSEDLDFLLSDTRREALMKAVPKIAAGLRLRMELAYPGCSIEFQVKRGDPDSDDLMDVWAVKWSHPNRIGKVYVKAEFYMTSKDILSAYRAIMARPGHRGSNVSVVLPVGDIVSLWADKVKVLATRNGMKWRDVHDLGYIADLLDRRGWPKQELLAEALETSASIYGKTLGDIRAGLELRLEEGWFSRTDEFCEDMKRWFPADLYADFMERGLFAQFLRRAEDEVRRAIEMTADRIPDASGRKP